MTALGSIQRREKRERDERREGGNMGTKEKDKKFRKGGEEMR
jgi:hypothetical protein